MRIYAKIYVFTFEIYYMKIINMKKVNLRYIFKAYVKQLKYCILLLFCNEIFFVTVKIFP